VSVRSARYNLLSLRNPKGLTVIPEERDAWAFLDAAGIKSSRQQRAVIELVRGLKNAQLWTKMKAIYPFVGGTATTHKFNLKDPRDADAAFRLSFFGGWTHSSNGSVGNANNAYADTFLVPSISLTNINLHLSYYSRTSSTATTSCELGVSKQYGGNDFVQLRSAANYAAGDVNTVLNYTTTNNASGYWLASTRANNDRKIWLNTNSEATLTTVNTSFITAFNLYLGARANVTLGGYQAVLYSDKQCAFATIGDGLTDTDATNLYNIVQRYQTSLGRQV
jgi:hypothetical protein